MKNEILDLIHVKFHALRMMKNYKPSQFELDLNKVISEEYQKDCKECRDRLEKIKIKEQNVQYNHNSQENKSFMDILRG